MLDKNYRANFECALLMLSAVAALVSMFTIASAFCIIYKGYVPVGEVTTYAPAVWDDYNQWHSSTVGTYNYNGTNDCQMIAEEHTGSRNLDTLQGMLNDTSTWARDRHANGIQMMGRNLTIEAEVSNIAVSASATWLRIAVVACVNLSSPFHDPIHGSNWSQVFMEFDWYWHNGTQASENGNFRFVKVGQFEPGTGYHHLSLDFTQTFVQHYDQSAYDNGTLWYVTASTIELTKANATIAVRPIQLWESQPLARAVNSTYMVVRGMDDRIYYRNWNWTGLEDWNVLPGLTMDSPAAAMLGNQLHVVVRGSDGNSLWYGYLTNITDPGSFSGWTLLSGATSSAPTLASNGTTLCLVVRGEDNLIYYRFYNDSSWGDWAALPSGATSDSPAAAMLGDELHIVVRGMDGYSFWHCYVNLTDNSFSGWTLLSGATQSKPVLAADQAENKLFLEVTGLDGRIYWRTYDVVGQSWADWSVIPSGATPEGPAATIFGGALQTVVQGMDGSSIWQGSINLLTTNFSGWTLLGGATPSAPELASSGTPP